MHVNKTEQFDVVVVYAFRIRNKKRKRPESGQRFLEVRGTRDASDTRKRVTEKILKKKGETDKRLLVQIPTGA